MNRLKLWGAIVLAVVAGTLLPSAAEAAIGTASGTIISNTTTVRWLSGAATLDTNTYGNNSNRDTTVSTTRAETIPDYDTTSLGVGQTATYVYQIMNNGNATDQFLVEKTDSALFGGASGWSCTLYVSPTVSTTLDDSTLQTGNVASGASTTCTVLVTSSNVPANSPDGSYMMFSLRVRSANDAAYAEYVGDNGASYAVGGGTDYDTAWGQVAAATITLTKVITTVTRGGAASLPVPGATLTYEIAYSKSGNGNADSVVLYDTIPANCTPLAMSNQDSAIGSDTTLTSDTGATGWSAQYATAAAPDLSFYSSDFSMWKSTGTFAAGGVQPTVVRWVAQRISGTDTNKKLYFRVVIQ